MLYVHLFYWIWTVTSKKDQNKAIPSDVKDNAMSVLNSDTINVIIQATICEKEEETPEYYSVYPFPILWKQICFQ